MNIEKSFQSGSESNMCVGSPRIVSFGWYYHHLDDTTSHTVTNRDSVALDERKWHKTSFQLCIAFHIPVAVTGNIGSTFMGMIATMSDATCRLSFPLKATQTELKPLP